MTNSLLPTVFTDLLEKTLELSSRDSLSATHKFYNSIASLSPEIQTKLKDTYYEALLWKSIETLPTPYDILKERIGGGGKMLEYFPEDYTITELNRLFPGWWYEDMKIWYEPTIQTWCCTGYGCIRYVLPFSGEIVVRKIFAAGGQQVFAKADTANPSAPEDGIKGARTEWNKMFGKVLGIGLDIYHQRITPELRSLFEDRIRGWELYATYWKQLASTYEKGHSFRNMLKIMPTQSQVNEVMEIVQSIKDLAPTGLVNTILVEFASHSNNEDGKEKLKVFLEKIRKIQEKLLTTNKGDQ